MLSRWFPEKPVIFIVTAFQSHKPRAFGFHWQNCPTSPVHSNQVLTGALHSHKITFRPQQQICSICSGFRVTNTNSASLCNAVAAPCFRMMFWTDWNRADPRIEKAYMDGTNRAVLVQQNLGLPNAIVIDPQAHSVCWADAGQSSHAPSRRVGNTFRLRDFH